MENKNGCKCELAAPTFDSERNYKCIRSAQEYHMHNGLRATDASRAEHAMSDGEERLRFLYP